jgi:hypothetical protein
MTNFLQRLKEKLIQAGGPSWSVVVVHTPKRHYCQLSVGALDIHPPSCCILFPFPRKCYKIIQPIEIPQNKQTKFPRSHDVSMFYILISLVNTIPVCASLAYLESALPGVESPQQRAFIYEKHNCLVSMGI